jgi:hypothetical protein
MFTQSLLSAASIVANLFQFDSQETIGKPSKLLEVGRLPALGCTLPHNADLDNTWNAYGCDINETIFLSNAEFMKSSGLLDAGYKYIVIDGKPSRHRAEKIAG